MNGFRQTYECGSVKVAYDTRRRLLNPRRFPVCIIANVNTVGGASWVYSILPTQSAELFWTAMLWLTIAVHNKAGLYVHRGSLVANVPGGRRERRGLRSAADRQFYVSVNPPVIPAILFVSNLEGHWKQYPTENKIFNTKTTITNQVESWWRRPSENLPPHRCLKTVCDLKIKFWSSTST